MHLRHGLGEVLDYESPSLNGAMASTQERYASKQQRRRILILQDFRCALCGADLECECDIDHIVPFSAGGSTTLQNLQALCKHCQKPDSMGAVAGPQPQKRPARSI